MKTFFANLVTLAVAALSVTARQTGEQGSAAAPAVKRESLSEVIDDMHPKTDSYFAPEIKHGQLQDKLFMFGADGSKEDGKHLDHDAFAQLKALLQPNQERAVRFSPAHNGDLFKRTCTDRTICEDPDECADGCNTCRIRTTSHTVDGKEVLIRLGECLA
ncbi:Uu.00g121670.m01.CDS01 [Anthostomella pinea]|uniref:Uu.00g121670.m01.CDS01 n=1 Tax=Anthostomella pinea TaxID=933095 RepID=A0AAI8VH34_9PEZI|nr:Uu.00g121670.m01.CDS01 [Anthostomella pinea]